MEAQNYLFIQHVLYYLGNSRICDKTLIARLITLIRPTLFKNKSKADARTGPGDKHLSSSWCFYFPVALHSRFLISTLMVSKGSLTLAKCMRQDAYFLWGCSRLLSVPFLPRQLISSELPVLAPREPSAVSSLPCSDPPLLHSHIQSSPFT